MTAHIILNTVFLNVLQTHYSILNINTNSFLSMHHTNSNVSVLIDVIPSSDHSLSRFNILTIPAWTLSHSPCYQDKKLLFIKIVAFPFSVQKKITLNRLSFLWQICVFVCIFRKLLTIMLFCDNLPSQNQLPLFNQHNRPIHS